MSRVSFLLAAPLLSVSARPALDPELVRRINDDPRATWKAKLPDRFLGHSAESVASLCGAWTAESHPVGVPFVEPELLRAPPRRPAAAIPTDFDGRSAWSSCSPISHVRDQTDCGACWAFAATEAFNDRWCIATGMTALLSVQDTAACCSGSSCQYSNGCVGGQIGAAWQWFVDEGVVTGGDYDDVNKTDSCTPFSLAPCTHHWTPASELPPCPDSEYHIPSCESTCGNEGYPTPYAQDKLRANSTFKIPHYPPSALQEELMEHGPVSTVFTVFDDFVHYSSGVYKHLEGSQVGSHAVVIVGWGVEAGENYWLVKNSWGASWGDAGFVKIGYGECGIENTLTAGYVNGGLGARVGAVDMVV